MPPRLPLVLVLAASLLACGCTGSPEGGSAGAGAPPPSGASGSASPARASSPDTRPQASRTVPARVAGSGATAVPEGKSAPAASRDEVVGVLSAWRHTVEWVGVPPLGSLDWRVLRPGLTLPRDTVIITDRGAIVGLRIPLVRFKPSFVDLVRGQRVLGYQVVGDQMELEVQPDSLLPLRPQPDALIDDAEYTATVHEVKGLAIYTPDHDSVARNYTELEAHNPPYPQRQINATSTRARPSLEPRPIHVKKGLGIRGKDFASLSDEERKQIFLDAPEGVYVTAVFPDSPADRAGIRTNDVIVKLGDVGIHNAADLMKAVEALPADKPVVVEYVRAIHDESNRSKTFRNPVVLGEFSGNANLVPQPDPTHVPSGSSSP